MPCRFPVTSGHFFRRTGAADLVRLTVPELLLRLHPTAAMIEFQHVFKSYGRGRNILADINFRVSAGEFVFVSGPSGAGKSTPVSYTHLRAHET